MKKIIQLNKKMRLILTRHGETEENRKGIIQGHTHGTLTDLGKEQARKVGERLKKEKIDIIYTSDLKRASDTAEEISKHHPKAKVIHTKELREVYLGSWQGKTREEIGLRNGPPGDYNIPLPKDAETSEEILKRAQDFIIKVIESHTKETVLLVGHNNINSAILTAIKGKDVSYMRELEPMKNTSVSIFDIYEDKSHKIHLLNCIEHLKESHRENKGNL